jgi:hypothetical protein
VTAGLAPRRFRGSIPSLPCNTPSQHSSDRRDRSAGGELRAGASQQRRPGCHHRTRPVAGVLGVKLHKPRCARSVLGPCHNGRARASAVTNGRRGFRGTAGRWPSRSRSWENADGRFGLWSRRSGLAPGSRRAATDGRGDQYDRWRTVADRRSARSLTPAPTSRFLMILTDLYPSDV